MGLRLHVGIAALVMSVSAEAGALDSITSNLNKLDRAICKSLDKANCPAKKKRQKAASSPDATTSPTKGIPIPRQRPQLGSGDIPVPRQRPTAETSDAVAPSQESPVVSTKPEQTAPADVPKDCRAALKVLQAEYETSAPVSEGACRVAAPIRLKSVATKFGRVTFPDVPLLNCNFAAQFGSWVAQQAAPLTHEKAGKALDRIWTGPGFVCRGRNGDSTSKLSEHAYGNAVDIEFVSFADRKVAIADAHGTPALRAMRQSACSYFTTVLGPGANSAHASHFHFDLGRHGKSDTYRICE